MSHKHHHGRRAFLSKFGYGCAGIAASTFLSSFTNMGLANAAAIANTSYGSFNDYKALVCVLLAGGNDSFNMLIPRGQDEYNEYAATRTLTAIPRNQLLPITPSNNDGKEYGLHYNLSGIKNLFDNDKLSFIANVGTIVRPTNMITFQAGNDLPNSLFSHSDQQFQWMTSIPQRSSITGWGGRMADILSVTNDNQSISMNISINGLNLFQQGSDVTPMAIEPNGNGVTLLTGAGQTDFYETLKRQTLDNLLDVSYQNAINRAYTGRVKQSKSNSFEFDAAISSAPTVATSFPNEDFGRRMRMVAQTIAARNNIGVKRQTFFVVVGGFDNHPDWTVHNDKMKIINDGLAAFYDATIELGLENEVTTYTISDFGRKLTTNGTGTDHAWGGNALVMGGAVNGGRIFGSYPDLYLGGNPLDVGGGRYIPTTSTDEYFADLALWFGASTSDLDNILPNIRNFWTPNGNNGPLGLMN